MAFNSVAEEDEQIFSSSPVTSPKTNPKTLARRKSKLANCGRLKHKKHGGKHPTGLFHNLYANLDPLHLFTNVNTEQAEEQEEGEGEGEGSGGAMSFGFVEEKQVESHAAAPPTATSSRSVVVESADESADDWMQATLERQQNRASKSETEESQSFSVVNQDSSTNVGESPSAFDTFLTGASANVGEWDPDTATDALEQQETTRTQHPKNAIRYYSLPGAKGVYRRLITYLLQSVWTVSEVFNPNNPGAATEKKLGGMIRQQLQRAQEAFHIST